MTGRRRWPSDRLNIKLLYFVPLVSTRNTWTFEVVESSTMSGRKPGACGLIPSAFGECSISRLTVRSAPCGPSKTLPNLNREPLILAMPDGPIKTFTLRGIKDSPPYLHHGRLMTLADTVELFNLVLGVRLNALVAYLLKL
jgi:hypothetical protein